MSTKLGPYEKIGTIWWFEFFDVPEKDLVDVENLLLAEIARFEKLYSRFLTDSDLAKFNQEKTFPNPSAEFSKLLQIAQSAYRETAGVFNICVKKKLDNLGYDKDYSFTSKQNDSEVPALDAVLKLEASLATLDDCAEIDFGGFGKGYLIDNLKDILLEAGISQFVINAGGDMYVSQNQNEPIKIGLQHPQNNSIAGTLKLKNQGFAASSPFVRRWTDQAGEIHHHLIGSQNARAVYVVAKSAVQADIWATSLAISDKLVTSPDIKWFYWDETSKQILAGN